MTARDLATWMLAADGPIADDERDAQQWAKDLDRHWRERRLMPDGTACGCQACIALSGFEPEDHDDVPANTLIIAPARVLAECAAKRQIVTEFMGQRKLADEIEIESAFVPGIITANPAGERIGVLLYAVRALAQPYAGRPGWRDEWASA